ncbi:MAG: Bug family tripartite tricarboxylate transporter substrate binding protein [Alphaproteobacteria bacterium]
MISRRGGIGLFAGAVLASGARAQSQASWPSRPIRLVVPFPAATGTDIIARLARPALERAVGQTIVVDNRPGAAGMLGVEAVARAAPDGYTLGVCSPSNMVINQHLMRMSYDPMGDLAPLSLFALLPSVLLVHPGVPARSLSELIKWLKENPETPYASPGVGTTQHLTGQLLMIDAGVQLVHVPHRNDASLADVIAGRVPLLIQPVLSTLPLIQNGQLRAIAVATAQRVPQLPDIPTFAETLPGFDAPTWVGFIAPARTPEPIMETVSQALVTAIANPEVRTRLLDGGAVPAGLNRTEFAAFLKREEARWGVAARAAGLKS